MPKKPPQIAPPAPKKAAKQPEPKYEMPPSPQQQRELATVMDALKSMYNLSPGYGLKDDLNFPQDSLARYQRERAAKGLSAQDRIRALMAAGAGNQAGMQQVAQRMAASPQAAMMLAKGGRK